VQADAFLGYLTIRTATSAYPPGLISGIAISPSLPGRRVPALETVNVRAGRSTASNTACLFPGPSWSKSQWTDLGGSPSGRLCEKCCSAVGPTAPDQSLELLVTPEDLVLIRDVVLNGGRKYTAGNIDRSRYERLVDLGWLVPVIVNKTDVVYDATDQGIAAAD
jgi:hypothetical protein